MPFSRSDSTIGSGVAGASKAAYLVLPVPLPGRFDDAFLEVDSLLLVRLNDLKERARVGVTERRTLMLLLLLLLVVLTTERGRVAIGVPGVEPEA